MVPALTDENPGKSPRTDFQVLVIGAGTAGLHMLYRMRERGLAVRVLEAGSGVGGTWYWNRYPGARLDSESFTYQYTFTEDLLADWDWSELFAAQPELEAYFNKFADEFDLRQDIEFNTRVVALDFDEHTNNWTVSMEDGRVYTSHVVITATGILSAPYYPDIPGMDSFQGELYHTATWPDKEVSFAGKQVAVIGTGATGIQAITEIAKDAGHLTVFQRTPNWAVPLRNRPLSSEEMAEIRAGYPEMFAKLQTTVGGFVHSWDPTPSTAYTDTALLERYEEAWNAPGFAKWFGLPNDIATDVKANQRWCEFVAEKIRQRVHDPKTAELLIPDHYFGTKRVPCESGYYEIYNQDNVKLVSIADNPIIEFTPTGLRTAHGEVEADIIVLATGFEAFVGALKRIDITGIGGRTLKDRWDGGPVTFLGIQVSGFPNLFIVGGPHGKGGHGNSPRCADPLIEWLGELAQYIFENDVKRVEADPAAEQEWTDHVYETAEKSLQASTASYWFGDNVPGRRRTYLAYIGGLPEFAERLQGMAAAGYPGLIITT
jgi:cation diffusion facilitator CzcD-associated flavoprotein CzcO